VDVATRRDVAAADGATARRKKQAGTPARLEPWRGDSEHDASPGSDKARRHAGAEAATRAASRATVRLADGGGQAASAAGQRRQVRRRRRR